MYMYTYVHYARPDLISSPVWYVILSSAAAYVGLGTQQRAYKNKSSTKFSVWLLTDDVVSPRQNEY